MERKQELLTIVGKGDSWKLCPFEGEIWACASVLATEGLRDKHYDKVFAFDKSSGDGNDIEECVAIARERNIPIVSALGYATERYPLLKIYDAFKTGYLRTTVSYMLALAIYQQRSPLAIYGVDQTGEYAEAKPLVTFWLGVALGRGIRFTIANNSFPNYLNPGMQGVMDIVNTPDYYFSKYGGGSKEKPVYAV